MRKTSLVLSAGNGATALEHHSPGGLNVDTAVCFYGDGEPKTPSGMLQYLTEFHNTVGLVADNFSLGGTVQQLEEHCAAMLGKAAAIFMPTGTLANHLAIRTLCQGKPRAIVQEQSHLYNDSGDCVPRLSGINLVPLAPDRPYFTLAELKAAVARVPTGRVHTPIGAVMIESPVRRQAGQIMPFEEMQAITGYCRQQQIPTHLDGARLYMMAAATGIAPAAYAALFDTVYVSLYKYFGAPFGAILAGPARCIDGLYHERRMFGGGLPAAHLAAGLALRGIAGFEARFAAAMARAEALFARLNALPGIQVRRFPHGSNIFPLELAATIDRSRFLRALRAHAIALAPDENAAQPLMLTVNTTLLRLAVEDIVTAFATALRDSA